MCDHYHQELTFNKDVCDSSATCDIGLNYHCEQCKQWNKGKCSFIVFKDGKKILDEKRKYPTSTLLYQLFGWPET